MKQKYKVSIIGNLAGTGYSTAKALALTNTAVKLFIAKWENALARPEWEDAHAHYNNLKIVEYGLLQKRSSLRFLRIFQSILFEINALAASLKFLSSNIIQSYTGSLTFSRVSESLFVLLRLRPYIACATGSDIREVAVNDQSKIGKKMLRFFQNASRVLLLNIDMIKVAKGLALKHAEFFPFAIDTEKFSPKYHENPYCTKDCMLIFMPSNLDWGMTDNAPNRNSTKGNNRLICAFARLIREGYKAHLVFFR